MSNQSITAECKWCGASVDPAYTGHCPRCGKTGKNVSATFNEEIRLRDSFNWELKRRYFEGHPKTKVIIFVLTFGSPFLGLVFSGSTGVVIGLALAAISYILGPYAATKVEEITKGNWKKADGSAATLAEIKSSIDYLQQKQSDYQTALKQCNSN